MRILHFDSVGGASGDMILGALIDLGVPVALIQQALASLAVEPIRVDALKTVVQGIQGTRVHVDVLEHDPHDDHSHGAAHDDAHGQHHGHAHHQGPAHAPHRNLSDIERIIRGSQLPVSVQDRALQVFRRLGEAEAKVHGTTLDQIHFHEVGALDSIADIVGCCLALEHLRVDGVSFGPLPQGCGVMVCQHGTYPNPPPATVLLLQGLPVDLTDEPCELVTPTGAALLASWRTHERPPEGSCLRQVGYGFGHRKLRGRVNCLRATLLEQSTVAAESDTVLVLETNLDDTTPELIGALCQRLLAEGALDVFTTPIFMKKQRPATLLTALCAPADRAKFLALLFRESTTFGVREHETQRTILARSFETVATPYGAIRVKVGRRGDAVCTRSPEMDDCLEAARAHGVPVRTVYAAAQRA